MVHQAPYTAVEGTYGPYSYRIKGDDRVQLTGPDGITTTLHNNTNNATDFVDQHMTVESIAPTEAALGDADLTLTVTGTGFIDGVSTILFNGGEEPTVFVSETELTTIVKPSTAEVAIAVPVQVKSGIRVSDPQMFTFTEAVVPLGRK